MTSGIMFAQPRDNKIENGLRYAFDTTAYRVDEIKRFVIAGFDLARKKTKFVQLIKQMWWKVVNYGGIS